MVYAATWSAVGEQAAHDPWLIVEIVGGAIFGLALAFLVIRALFRQGRYRVAETFGEDDRLAVRTAVANAEKKTVGEILPVVVEQADAHPGADWLSALTFVLVGSLLLGGWLPWNHPALLLASQFAMGLLGFALARLLPDFKRLFIFPQRAREVADEQAFQEFYLHGLHRTEAATGVLIFVSLLERRVVVLADEGIHAQVAPDFWDDVDHLILDGIRKGSLREGLTAGIERAGEQLAKSFPWKEGDRNEIPNRVIVRKK